MVAGKGAKMIFDETAVAALASAPIRRMLSAFLTSLGPKNSMVTVVNVAVLKGSIESPREHWKAGEPVAEAAKRLSLATLELLADGSRAEVIAVADPIETIIVRQPDGPSIPGVVEWSASGDKVISLLGNADDDEYGDRDSLFADPSQPVEPYDDPIERMIRSHVADQEMAETLIALPIELTEALVAIGDGASPSLLGLVGPGSKLVLLHLGIADLSDAPPHLTEYGKRVASAAHVALASNYPIETPTGKRLSM